MQGLAALDDVTIHGDRKIAILSNTTIGSDMLELCCPEYLYMTIQNGNWNIYPILIKQIHPIDNQGIHNNKNCNVWPKYLESDCNLEAIVF